MKVRRHPASDYTPEYADVIVSLPNEEGREVSITVWGPEHGQESGRINWPGIGSVSPEDAAAVGAGLAFAAGLATALSGPKVAIQ